MRLFALLGVLVLALALDRDHLSPGRKTMSCTGTLNVTAAGGS